MSGSRRSRTPANTLDAARPSWTSQDDGQKITQRNLDIQPTITIRPGAPVRVLVTRDLILAPWRGKAS
ncbi:TrbI/VirB10 family protein [Sphingobium herbicidovorans]